MSGDAPGAPRQPRLLLAVTDPVSLSLMRGLPDHLRHQGWAVTVVAGGASPLVSAVVPMRREPAPLADVVALVRWLVLLARRRQDVVVASTPKAGLLALVAAWLLRIRSRIYLLRGLRLETAVGLRRSLLLALERLSVGLATEVLCVSPSLRAEYERLSLGRSAKASVLGLGSSNGVDTDWFRPSSREQQLVARRTLGLTDAAPVVGYVGRLTPDKGLDHLVEAAVAVAATRAFQLLVVGEEDVPGYRRQLGDRLADGGVAHRIVDHLVDVRPAFAAMDVLCFPSLREGLPNVVLEAAASGLPVVTTSATGCRDAVVPGETGWVVPVASAGALADALREALDDPARASELGRHGREWVRQEFGRELVWARLDDFLGRAGLGREPTAKDVVDR